MVQRKGLAMVSLKCLNAGHLIDGDCAMSVIGTGRDLRAAAMAPEMKLRVLRVSFGLMSAPTGSGHEAGLGRATNPARRAHP
jgi:hypothetical protein